MLRASSPTRSSSFDSLRAWRVSALAVGVLTALNLGSCARGPKGAGGFQMPPVPVEVSAVRSQTVRDDFRAVGTLEAENDVTIVSENAGIVRSLPFREG